MKIEYRMASVGDDTDYTVLADESVSTLGAAISGFAPAFSISPMVTPAYGAAVPIALDLGNGNWKVVFTVERQHASADAALAFIQAEPLKFTGNQDLKITVGAQVTYLANSVRTEVTPEPHSDQSSKIKYSFGYGNYTQTAP
jgi:hypothetical protein